MFLLWGMNGQCWETDNDSTGSPTYQTWGFQWCEIEWNKYIPYVYTGWQWHTMAFLQDWPQLNAIFECFSALQLSFRPFAWGLYLFVDVDVFYHCFLLSLFGSALLSLIRNPQMDVLYSLTLPLSHTCVCFTQRRVPSPPYVHFFNKLSHNRRMAVSELSLGLCVCSCVCVRICFLVMCFVPRGNLSVNLAGNLSEEQIFQDFGVCVCLCVCLTHTYI